MQDKVLEVRKKDNTIVKFDSKKILDAVQKSADRVGYKLRDCDKDALLEEIYQYFSDGMYKRMDLIPTGDIHIAVVHCLKTIGLEQVAYSYQQYRDYKNTYAKSWDHIKNSADDILYLGDKENANFDSSLSSTKGSLIRGATTKELYRQFYLSRRELELIDRGDIYIHDLRDMILNNINCCLFDMGNVLKGGFKMSNVEYTEPNSVLAAIQVIGDITLCATAQQFGGFTIPEIDKVLLPYAMKSFDKYRKELASLAENLNVQVAEKSIRAEEYALKKVNEELHQGFQALELKLNTVPCSRGDFAFTTLTFGEYQGKTIVEKILLKMINHAILDVRMKGHGGKQVVFPKLVYLYNEEHVKHDSEVFDHCVRCSQKCMYPDYLSLTGDPDNNVVAHTYLNYGVITSPMGCRAYLTPWCDPVTKKYVTVGRCNIGAVSLNLPLIYKLCEQDGLNFWTELDDRLEVIREFFKKRYDLIAETKCCTNPLAFCEGGLYHGRKNPDDVIGDLIDYMTASFGITALDEYNRLVSGKSIAEDNTAAVKVVNFINDRITRFKIADKHLYALYGTPAESLCATQAEQYRKATGDNQFGSYFSNSFHCNVKEEISPFTKQDKEHELFHMVNGGHIQYVRLTNPENFSATKKIIERGMRYGFYQGVNFDSAYCEDCHEHSTNVLFKCPHCGSSNITVISRVCGYLGYSNVNGNSRINQGKMDQIKERVSM